MKDFKSISLKASNKRSTRSDKNTATNLRRYKVIFFPQNLYFSNSFRKSVTFILPTDRLPYEPIFVLVYSTHYAITLNKTMKIIEGEGKRFISVVHIFHPLKWLKLLHPQKTLNPKWQKAKNITFHYITIT